METAPHHLIIRIIPEIMEQLRYDTVMHIRVITKLDNRKATLKDIQDTTQVKCTRNLRQITMETIQAPLTAIMEPCVKIITSQVGNSITKTPIKRQLGITVIILTILIETHRQIISIIMVAGIINNISRQPRHRRLHHFQRHNNSTIHRRITMNISIIDIIRHLLHLHHPGIHSHTSILASMAHRRHLMLRRSKTKRAKSSTTKDYRLKPIKALQMTQLHYHRHHRRP